MHKEQHLQQHLKSNNNIISKFAVIALSIVLLTGISLVPALQIGVNGQVQQQQQHNNLYGYDKIFSQGLINVLKLQITTAILKSIYYM